MGFFYLDIWYPKEHVSSGMALITSFSNQNILLTGLYNSNMILGLSMMNRKSGLRSTHQEIQL